MKITLVTDNSPYVGEELKSKMKKALLACGMLAEAHAKVQCPVDTGRLRNSITHAETTNQMQVGTNVEYGPYVELGTSHNKAQPYLRPAIENHIGEYENLIKTTLKL